jgi:hypothetical protein
MSVGYWVECPLAGGAEVVGEILPQRQFAHHSPKMALPEIEPGPLRLEAGE